MLSSFDYHRASSISEALELLSEHPGDSKILAGGTDLLLQMAKKKSTVKRLVCLQKIEALKYLQLTDDNLFIGANITHREVEVSTLVKKEMGALHDAVGQVGSVQIRNVATVAGNICNAAPSADTAGPLLALGAEVKIAMSQGKKTVALKDFFQGPGQTVLQPDEIVLGITIPRMSSYTGSAYFKLAKRKAMDLALIGVAAYVRCTPDLQKFAEVRIALSTVAPTPIRVFSAEEFLTGAEVDERAIQEAADLAAQEGNPRTSWRSTAEYRREMIRVFVGEAIKKALQRVQHSSLQR